MDDVVVVDDLQALQDLFHVCSRVKWCPRVLEEGLQAGFMVVVHNRDGSLRRKHDVFYPKSDKNVLNDFFAALQHPQHLDLTQAVLGNSLRRVLFLEFFERDKLVCAVVSSFVHDTIRSLGNLLQFRVFLVHALHFLGILWSIIYPH